MRGFSLIELMVACAIIAILAAIAIPSYAYYLRQSRRSDAEATLMDIAQREQQYLLDQRVYATNTTTLSTTIPVDVSSYYTVTINAPAVTPPVFTVTATPIAGSVQGSDYTLTLDNTGVRSPAAAW